MQRLPLFASLATIACLALLFQFQLRSTVSEVYLGPEVLSETAEGPEAPVTLTAAGTAPFRLPKLIHQTVKDKSRLSCQQKRVIDSWKTLNPGYAHRLWDDADIRQFMLQYYPDLVPIPFDQFLTGTERSDLWRVLVLHQLGGVYADMDVQCLKPIDQWNAEHGHDAAVLLGVENYNAKNKHPIHVVNWVLAAVPGHPLLASMPVIVAKAIQQQFFELARPENVVLDKKQYEAGIIDRTGPAALSWAMYDYFHSINVSMSNVDYKTVTGPQGLVAGGVRVLPIGYMATGWEVAQARKSGKNLTCEDMGKRVPEALVCHMFWGSWRSAWNFREQQTYDDC